MQSKIKIDFKSFLLADLHESTLFLGLILAWIQNSVPHQ